MAQGFPGGLLLDYRADKARIERLGGGGFARQDQELGRRVHGNLSTVAAVAVQIHKRTMGVSSSSIPCWAAKFFAARCKYAASDLWRCHG